VGISFWVVRFAKIYIGSFLVLVVAQLLKGRDASSAATHAALWGLIATSIFIAARLYRSNRGETCTLCNDTPQSSPVDRGKA
jgi:hypothetical protein